MLLNSARERGSIPAHPCLPWVAIALSLTFAPGSWLQDGSGREPGLSGSSRASVTVYW